MDTYQEVTWYSKMKRLYQMRLTFHIGTHIYYPISLKINRENQNLKSTFPHRVKVDKKKKCSWYKEFGVIVPLEMTVVSSSVTLMQRLSAPGP